MSTRKTEPLNTVIVSQPSDLPFNSSTSQHELVDGTVYRFDGFVSSPDPILLGNETPLIGGHAANDGFIRTGSGSTIIGSNSGLFMRNMYCHAPNGTVFDVTGDTSDEVLVDSCSFSDDAGIANISDLGTIDGMRVPTFINCNFGDFDAGIKFRGDAAAPEKILMDNCPIRNVTTSGVTCIDFGGAQEAEIVDIIGCYVKDVQNDTQIVNVQTGGSPSEVFQYRGNTHDSTVVQSNILNGEADVTAVGYTVTDSSPLRNSSTIGEFALTTDTTTTINTQGAWVKVAGAGTVGNETERVQETGTNGELEYLGRRRTNVKVSAAASIEGGNGSVYQIAVAKNGTIQDASIAEVETDNRPQTVSTTAIEDLSTNDTLGLYVRNQSGTSNIDFLNYNFNFVGV